MFIITANGLYTPRRVKQGVPSATAYLKVVARDVLDGVM